MKPTLRVFNELVGEGLHPIAVHSNTKIPILEDWNSKIDHEANRDLIRRPFTNVGILLGKIVDVEGDSKKANDTIAKVIGDYPHPVYKSNKSYHHLFINPDPNLTILKYRNIEFRGHKHQSIVPPSTVNGVTYEWVHQIFPIPEMPESLLKYYYEVKEKKAKGHDSIKPQRKKPYCDVCEKRQFVHVQRFRLELMAFKERGLNWQCNKCRKIDVRQRVREIKKVIKNNESISDWRDWVRWQESRNQIGRTRT